MSKCCEKKVFKCEDMDGVGKIFVRTNATLKAETPIRFKTDSGYVQETTFEKGVDISIDETAIKVDLSKYPKQEEVDNDISLAKDNVKDWVRSNYLDKEDVNREFSGVNEYIQSGLDSVREETEKTYLKKSDATSGNIEYINETYFDVAASDTHLDTANGLRISFKKYAEKAVFSFEENDDKQHSGLAGIYAHGMAVSGFSFEIVQGLEGGEINNTYLNGILEAGKKGIYRILLIFESIGKTKFSIKGTVEKVK